MAKKKKIKKSDWKTIKWIARVCKKELFNIIILLITQITNAVLTIVYANFSKNIMNAATEEHSLDRVIYFAVLFFCLITFQLLLSLFSKSVTERARCKIEWILKQYMLRTIMKKDYSKISEYHTGELQNRMFNDVNVIANNFTTLLPSMVYFVVKLCCAFIYLVILDKIFAFLFLIAGIVVFIITFSFRSILKKLHKKVQESEGKTRSFIQEALTSLLVVKSFAVEEKIADKTDDLQAENFKHKMRRRVFGIAANAGLSFAFNFGYVFAMALCAYRLLNGMSFGTVTAILQLVNQIQSPFASLSSAMPTYFEIIASGERLMEIDALPDEEADNEVNINVADTYSNLDYIDFNNISFRYDRDIILDSTSLRVNKGDFVAIMGISGIGKSTLLKLLLGVFKADDGNIDLYLNDGTSIPVDFHTRRLFSYVPQGNFLLSGTIKENLLFINSEATDEEIDKAIKISCADQFIDELPEGLETVIGERGVGLSEGQLQRLAIARSLLSKSPVMLLDEATSALDEETEKRFLSNLQELNDKTCIIVSHKKAALEICNKHIQIVDHKVVLEEK